jgi:hypothetical protein
MIHNNEMLRITKMREHIACFGDVLTESGFGMKGKVLAVGPGLFG